MAKDLVLLTGGTGFLGYAILLELLKSGYKVRVAARSQAKTMSVLESPTIRSMAVSNEDLSFVIVPDMASPGAYDDAMKGVQCVVHAASPLPSFGKGAPWAREDIDGAFVTQSKAAVLNILESATTTGKDSIRRIVMTSSTVAVAPAQAFLEECEARHVVRGSEDRSPVPPPPYSSDVMAYAAGKTAALNSSEDFMKANDTPFDLLNIIPSWIFGTDELVTDVKGMRGNSSNSMLTNVLLGNKTKVELAGNAVHVADVASAHVKALDPVIEGNQAVVLNVPMKWENAIPIAKDHFPEAFKAGFFKEDGKQPSIPLKWDASKAKTVLGIDLAPFEVMVEEVARQYLQLLRNESKEEE